MAEWIPGDHAELTAGWRLWLALSSSAWPGPDWDGSPSDAVRGLREFVASCDDIMTSYLAEGGKNDTTVVGLLRSMHLAASWIFELWNDDTLPLDSERASLLHGDLAGFADHAQGVRTLLAVGGGWSALPL
ncbi:hypothetical protein ACFWY9_04710 [Amycolatopsis sp. NPDC059027]|uniref:hypothetical protein n=1 Tax=unclassified Amycolatopsis TaxID=2618356 RepID=UPI00367343CE